MDRPRAEKGSYSCSAVIITSCIHHSDTAVRNDLMTEIVLIPGKISHLLADIEYEDVRHIE